jgi:hypothetical protein
MNWTLIKTIYSLCAFIAICSAGSIVFAIETKENAQDYNRQIVDLLKHGNCDQAEFIVEQLKSQNRDYSDLPEFYYQLILCYKNHHKGWGALELSIDEFFKRQLNKLVDAKSCREAEGYLGKIDKKYHTYWSYESGLCKVANCYEALDAKKSEVLYRHVLSAYPKSDEAKKAKQRLNYLTGDRSWIYPTASPVIDGVKAALLRKDIKILEKYASKSNYQVSFEDEWQPEQFNEKGKEILKSAFERSEPSIGPLKSEHHRYILQVVFSAEDFPFWYFTFDEMEGGWQWTGVIISNVKRTK